jgi:hypothetical protein
MHVCNKWICKDIQPAIRRQMHDGNEAQHSKAAPDATTQQFDTNCEHACKTAQCVSAKTAEFLRARLQEFSDAFDANECYETHDGMGDY